MRRTLRLGRLTAIGCVLAAVSTEAQTVRGQVFRANTPVPLDGAMAVLVDSAGNRVHAMFTNRLGDYAVRALTPGSYTIDILRIGFAKWSSDPFELTLSADVALDLDVPMQAVQLGGLVIEEEAVCGNPNQGRIAALLWEEARKALLAATLTAQQRAYDYEITRYRRALDRQLREVGREDAVVEVVTSDVPFQSASPEALAELGYHREIESGVYEFFGPDALVILSDVFLGSHCFDVEIGEGENDGAVGLRFEPSERRDVSDVKGTIWIDRQTNELSRIDFSYTDVRIGIPTGRLGGQLHYEALPDGRWIIRRWWLRMPRLAISTRRLGPTNLGFVETVVEVTGVIRNPRARS